MTTILLINLFILGAFAQNSFPITRELTGDAKVYDVVIVGAGLSGLTAAREIRKGNPNATVLLLEARGQVGGRIRAESMSTAEGDRWIDTGAQFISPTHERLISLAQELGVNLQRQGMCGDRSLMINGKRSKRDIKWDTSLADDSSISGVLSSNVTSTLARQDVEQFATAAKLSQPDADSMNRLLQTVYDAPENTVSALQVLLTSASENSSLPEMLLNLGHGNSLLVEEGLFYLVRVLADGNDIRYNTRVVNIDQSALPIDISTDSENYYASQVIVTVPPPVISNIAYTPSLDRGFTSFLENYSPAGHAYYFTLTYSYPFWRYRNQSGQIIFTSNKGPILWATTFDTTPTNKCSADAVNETGILYGIAHFASDRTPTEQRHNKYIELVAQSLNESELTPLDVRDHQFSADTNALGTISVLRPGAAGSVIGQLGKYLNGIYEHGNNVIFASAEFSNISLGLMNGAVNSGQLAGQAILKRIGITADGSTPAQSLPQSLSNILPLFGVRMMDPPQSIQTTTPFAYHTSSQYPPGVLDATTTAATSAQETAAQKQVLSGNNANNVQFQYETTTHYPELPSLSTTRLVHFSNGNMDEATTGSPYDDQSNDIGEMVLHQNDAAVQSTNGKKFVYSTSTMYPSLEVQSTTPLVHFSNGNLDQNAVLNRQAQTETSNSQPSGATANSTTPRPSNQLVSGFRYETSSMYPPTSTQIVQTSTIRHFSMGNLDQPETVIEQSGLMFDDTNMLGEGAQQFNGTSERDLILRDLQSIVLYAHNTSDIHLVTQLTSVVQRLLETMQAKENL